MDKKRKQRKLTTFGKIFFTLIGVALVSVIGILLFTKKTTLNYKVEEEGNLITKNKEIKYLSFVGFELPKLEYTNYNFDKWKDENDNVVTDTKWLKAMTLTAEISPKQFPIETTQETKDLVPDLPENYTYGKKLDLTKYCPEKSDAKFEYWLVNGRKLTEIPAGVSETVNLTARYLDKDFLISYKNIEDAVMPDYYPVVRKSNTEISNLPQPVKENYVFTGWYADEGLTIPVEKIKESDNYDITLYAGWEENADTSYSEETQEAPLEEWQIEEQRLQEYYNFKPDW